MGCRWGGKGLVGTGSLFVLTILTTLVLMAGAAAGLVLFIQLLGVAMLAGAVGGAIHGVLHHLDNWGRLGSWLRWTASIFGYVVAFGFFIPNWPFSLADPALYAIAIGISAVGAVGLMLLDDRRPSRPSPRRFRLLQNRELLWSTADRVRARLESEPAEEGDPGRRPEMPRSREGVSTRKQVKAEWMETIRRSTSRLSWWTRE